MSSKEIKEKVELEIFQKFAEVCPLQISPSSIQKCQPPRPDILCKSKLQEETFFELVELTDPKFNSRLHSEHALEKLLEQAAQKRSGFMERYSTACILILFKPNTRKSKKYIEKILDLLLSDCIPVDFEGEIIFQATTSEEGKALLDGWKEKIKALEVHRNNRWNHQTPCFWTNEAWPVDVKRVRNRVEEKFKKTYNLHPFNQAELLGYFNYHPQPPPARWKDDVHAFVQNHLRHSSFARVWIFDARKNSLLYVYPNL